ncbi:MAG: hypothetical protein IJO32_03950 [Bacilli bacterium]|nr:hypothetical protein [Bacilli bacterium]
MNGNTFYISIDSNSNNGSFGSIESANNSVGITLGKQMDSSQLLHEMMHAYRAYNETPETYNASTLNGEIEAQYAQYVYNKKLQEQGDTPVIVYNARRAAIIKLEVLIDHKGNLLSGRTINELNKQINNILTAFNRTSTYSQSKYKYDDSREPLSNFSNLQTITSDCP